MENTVTGGGKLDRILIGTCCVLLLRTWPADATAQPKVVPTLPTLTAMARELGGDHFEYVTPAKPDQDPHFVAPSPSPRSKTSQAALLLELGMQLEISADE